MTSSDASFKICIVGGGFGGLYTALYLQKYHHLRNSRILLIEPKTQFLFTPMMYELITDELKEWEIAPTYSSLLAGTNIEWKPSRAETFDLAQQTIHTADGEIYDYDYLVAAQGAKSRPVEISGVEEHTLTFRSLQDAQTLKARLAQLVQIQTLSASGRLAAQTIHIVVIGGGASGVELAAKVSDYLSQHASGSQAISAQAISAQITLIEHGQGILKHFEKGLQRVGQKALELRGIQILTETAVVEVHADAVTVQASDSNRSETSRLTSHLTLWAVGTEPYEWLGKTPVAENDRGQRKTRRSLQLLDYDNVFVLGDSADIRSANEAAIPNTAQAAFQAASKVAANLSALTQGKQPKPFNYLHLGDMVTLGIGDAGLWSFGITLGGWFAALCRRVVYIFRMPTRRHQFKVARRAISELWSQVWK